MQIQADVQTKQAEMERKREETFLDAQLKVLELQTKAETQITSDQIRRSATIARETMKAQADLIKEAVSDQNQGANNTGRA